MCAEVDKFSTDSASRGSSAIAKLFVELNNSRRPA